MILVLFSQERKKEAFLIILTNPYQFFVCLLTSILSTMSYPLYLGLLTLGLYILRSLCGNGFSICSRNLTLPVCCNNYHLNKDRTDCVECDPGFWQDCKTRCFEGYYGRLCESKCACKNGEICDYILGCVKKSSSNKADDTVGNCSNSESGCCPNYYKKGKECVACPIGYYQKNCSESCPSSFFGKFCLSKCKCNASLCHHVYGCPDNNTGSKEAEGIVGKCLNIKSGCCPNYYKKGNECVACPDGYYDDNCSLSCPFLRYGQFCLNKCDCNASLCHHVYGCQYNNGNGCITGCNQIT